MNKSLYNIFQDRIFARNAMLEINVIELTKMYLVEAWLVSN